MLTPEDLVAIHHRRYSTKKFQRKKLIPEEAWAALEEALLLTPSSYNIQPWKFVVVADPALKKSLKPISFHQSQVEDCSHLVVLCALERLQPQWVKKLMERYSTVRSQSVESLEDYERIVTADLITGPRKDEILNYNTLQCYIALGNLMTSAALLGIDSCPIGGFLPEAYDEILQLKGTGWKSVVLCALGYRDPSDKYQSLAKVRFAHDNVFEYR